MASIILNEVEARLMIVYSPDQISKPRTMSGLKVSYETIYQHVAPDKKAGGDLVSHLRIHSRRRYRRRNKVGRGDKIPNQVDIAKRPAVVYRRTCYGDWEADLIQDGAESGFLLSSYELKSRIGRLHLLPDKKQRGNHDCDLDRLHGLVDGLLECESYFCKLYRSWEKGGVENYNGRIRQYFSKGHDFATITPQRLLDVEEEINQRPREVLTK
jgi:transposase, IS30 family